MKIAIVTDSTCDWAFDEFARRNVEMVPLKICFSNESFADQIEISTDEFYDCMIDAVDLPSTSQPSPHDFAKLFERLAEEGYEGAVCLHIALPLSGTPLHRRRSSTPGSAFFRRPRAVWTPTMLLQP